jgi:Helix-turn-helix domain
VPAWRGQYFVGDDRHAGNVRTAYRCRAYPDEAQQQVLARTFGCVRVVWNRTLAARYQRYATEHRATSYAQTDRALTAMKKDPGLAWLNEVSSVPLQQALRHQHAAFQAFFARRARYPRLKSRHGRQCAHYTRSAFSMRGGVLRLAKTGGPLRFVWSATCPRTRSRFPDTTGVLPAGPARSPPVVDMNAGSVQRGHDVLDAGVVLEAVHGQVLAVAGLLEAAVRHLGHQRDVGVDPHAAEVQPA